MIISLETFPIRSSSKVARHDIFSLPILKDIKPSWTIQLWPRWGARERLGKRSSPAQCLTIKRLEQILKFFVLMATRFYSGMVPSLHPVGTAIYSPTLRRMAQLAGHKTKSPTHDWIEWETETKPDPALNDLSRFENASAVAPPPKVAVMTEPLGFWVLACLIN